MQSSSPEIEFLPAQILSGSFIGIEYLYIFGGIYVAILIYLIYLRIIKEQNGFKTKLHEALSSIEIGKIAGTAKSVQENAAKKVTLKKASQRVSVMGRMAQREDVTKVTALNSTSCRLKEENKYKAKLRKAFTSLNKTFTSSKIGKIAITKKTVQENAAYNKSIPKKVVPDITIQERTVQQKNVQECTVKKVTFPKDVIFKREAVSKGVWAKDYRLYIALPILCICIAELLIFTGRLALAVWVHIGVLLFLSFSNVLVKDPRVQKINIPLMLLPVLRILNLSIPIFFDTTLYSFIFLYSPLVVSVAAIIINQKDSLEDIGITTENIVVYMILAIPLSFLLGLGEYMTIRPGYLIPDLTFINLLKLTIVMVFFVGLIEELIFRSILQVRLEQVLGIQGALVITSILFGLMHSGYFNLNEILYTGFVGFILGVLFYKTKSLPFIAVLHGFVNVFLFGILPLLFLA
jgi:membrane protease YdiL (CAAX protease family)